MSKLERVDELAPIIRLAVGGARAVSSAFRSFAKKKAMEKAKEKAKEELIGTKKDPQVDQAIEQEWGKGRKDEALHTAYKNLIMEMIGVTPEKLAQATLQATSKNADDRDARIQRRQDSIAAHQKQQEADRIAAQERKAKEQEATEIARQKRVAAFGKNRRKVEARRLKNAKAEARRLKNAKAEARRLKNAKAKKAAVATAVEKSTKRQNQSQRGTELSVRGRVLDRFKDRMADFASLKGLRAGLSNTRQSFNRGRAAMKARRPRIDFSHTEYQKIGAILAEAKGVMPKKFSVKSGDKSSAGGLTAKGVKRYRAANPGSKLKTAVTTKPSKLKKGSKSANRRKSFCARMGGMKKRLTSSKTANDPNSRINKALRKWNC